MDKHLVDPYIIKMPVSKLFNGNKKGKSHRGTKAQSKKPNFVPLSLCSFVPE
jgi:hypothetical protein